MAEEQEISELAQEDGVAEVQVRRGGIEAGLDGELGFALELPEEVVFGDELDRTAPDALKLFGRTQCGRTRQLSLGRFLLLSPIFRSSSSSLMTCARSLEPTR